MQHEGERVPLFSLEAEASVISAVLLQPDAWERMVEILPSEDLFYQPAHREFYRALRTLRDAGEPFGAVQVVEALRRESAMERAGGPGYLAQLTDYVVTAANIEADARIVRDKYQLRRLNGIGRDIVALTETGRPVIEVQEEAERLVYAAGEGVQVDGTIQHLRVGMHETLVRLEKNEPDVLTGFADYDRMSSGFARGDLVILAARPSMGKTSLAIQVAINVAVREKKPVPLFSLEMSQEAIARRALFTEARVNIAEFRRRPGENLDEAARLHQALATLNQTPLFTHCTARTAREMRAQCRRLVSEHGPLAMIAIDYLGKMRGSGQAEKRVHELGEITGDLKALAMEFAVPVLLLSQLSRAVEARPDKRPMMSDLRDSGEIEQDADTVLLLYRPEYYFGPVMKMGEGKNRESVSVEGKAELIVAKQRNGETGTVHLRFHKEFTRFENAGYPHHEESAR